MVLCLRPGTDGYVGPYQKPISLLYFQYRHQKYPTSYVTSGNIDQMWKSYQVDDTNAASVSSTFIVNAGSPVSTHKPPRRKMLMTPHFADGVMCRLQMSFIGVTTIATSTTRFSIVAVVYTLCTSMQ